MIKHHWCCTLLLLLCLEQGLLTVMNLFHLLLLVLLLLLLPQRLCRSSALSEDQQDQFSNFKQTSFPVLHDPCVWTSLSSSRLCR